MYGQRPYFCAFLILGPFPYLKTSESGTFFKLLYKSEFDCTNHPSPAFCYQSYALPLGLGFFFLFSFCPALLAPSALPGTLWRQIVSHCTTLHFAGRHSVILTGEASPVCHRVLFGLLCLRLKFASSRVPAAEAGWKCDPAYDDPQHAALWEKETENVHAVRIGDYDYINSILCILWLIMW